MIGEGNDDLKSLGGGGGGQIDQKSEGAGGGQIRSHKGIKTKLRGQMIRNRGGGRWTPMYNPDRKNEKKSLYQFLHIALMDLQYMIGIGLHDSRKELKIEGGNRCETQ